MSDAVTRLNAALRGRYAIEREIGEGGMATVFLAKDLKHKRRVALKVLKPDLAAVVGAERFLAEIETTANLQHPHILPLFDSGEAGGFLFYVMPYVEGETLREKIDREKQLPVDEAVGIAVAVAGALQTAHERGVIHRDIKPGNILLSRGQPLVADFGIALAVSAGGGVRLTETGLSLGTPYYMSPEQATGDQTVGPASDTYALAAVLYEMLTGDPPFVGSTAQAVLGKIIQGAPVSPTEVRKAVPAGVDAAVRKGLERIPADRFTSTQAFAQALGDPGFTYGEAAGAGAAASAGPWKAVATTLGVLLVASTGVAGWGLVRPPDPQPTTRFEVALGASDASGWSQFGVNLALSPDGTRLLFRRPTADGVHLWQRPMDQLEAHPIVTGTGGVSNAVYSPDGTSVAFMAGPSIRTLSLDGGPATTVVNEFLLNGFVSMDWGDDGMIYFTDAQNSVFRVPASGGELEALPISGSAVQVLPDGHGLIFRQGGQIMASTRDGESVTPLLPGLSARYAASGHLVYVTDDQTLMAVAFDLDGRRVTGPAVPLVEDVLVNGAGYAQFALSESGTLAYFSDPVGAWEIVKVARTGALEVIHPDPGAPILSLAVSPDESRLAVSIGSERNRIGTAAEQDLWIKQLDGGPLTRLTFEGSGNLRATWTPDGASVTFVSNRGGGWDLWTARADGTGSATLVQDVDRSLYGADWSADGEWIVSQAGGAGTRDILAFRPGRDSVPTLLVADPPDEFSPALSPDGRWLAYVSSESGRWEVFVRPFPNVEEGKWQVSQGGGQEPVWASSGRELFYRTRGAESEMVAVQVVTSPQFAVAGRQTLFPTRDFHSSGSGAVATYGVSRDDQHFYMIRGRLADPDEVTIVLNFFEELQARASG